MRRLLPIILLCLSLAAGTWLGMKAGKRLPAGPLLKAYFLNVGQGDCTLVESPDGKNVLIDTGDEESAPYVVKFLQMRGVKQIDLLVMTHPHSDHIGGVSDILKAFPVKRIIDSAYPYGSMQQRRVLEDVEKAGIPYQTAQAGQALSIGKSLKALVLFPDSEFMSGTEGDTDNNSVVLQLIYGQMKFLFPGDIRSEAQGSLISSGRDLQSNVIKIPHHGSNDACTLEFLRQVKPDYAVISVGKDNRYGYPQSTALRKLNPERLGAALYRTDVNGTVLVQTDGQNMLVETER